MATKKPKSNKTNKSKSTKPQTAAKTVTSPVSEAPDTKTTNEELDVVEIEAVEVDEVTVEADDDQDEEIAEISAAEEDKEDESHVENEKPASSHTSTAKRETTAAKHISSSTTTVSDNSKSCFKGFFAKKYEEKESILTIFKNHKFYGALLGEVLGTMLLALLLFVCSLMGVQSIATYIIAMIAILIAVYAFSGACLNPIVTIGMIASRRMSVIRGVMYIIAEVLGAWLGWLIFNSFHLAGGDSAYAISKMAEIEEGKFWIMAMIELMGAIIIAFFFARALKYKRSVFTFAATVAGGVTLAFVIGYVVSVAFFGLNTNFIMNPAVALMMQIFPTAGDSFGEIMSGVCQALGLWVVLPMLGGVCGFYLSDFTAKLSGEE